MKKEGVERSTLCSSKAANSLEVVLYIFPTSRRVTEWQSRRDAVELVTTCW